MRIELKLGVATAVMFFLSTAATLADEGQCIYAGKVYTAGGTVCECPSMTGDGYQGDAKITSRRLVCNKTGWQPDNTMCLELNYKGTSSFAEGDLPKYHKLYCRVRSSSTPSP
ncbi:hypothetical protein ACVJGD_002137 [Bradyrhizobium sp. USDA 10063]